MSDSGAERKKVLVTGSGGMLGSELVNVLAEAYDVTGLDIAGKGGSGRAGFIKCDVTDREAAAGAVSGSKPDVIIHAAAWTDVDGCELDAAKAGLINAEGAGNVAAAAAAGDVPLVYVSTDFVFDGEKREPYTHLDAPNPGSVYARTKLEGEKRVSSLRRHVIVRTSWLYGRNGKNFVDTITEKALKEKELKVVSDQVGSPTYAVDLARAIEAILKAMGTWRRRREDADKWGIYHVSNRGTVSWYEYAKRILELSGIHGVRVTAISTEELKRPAPRPRFSGLDTSRFEDETGFVLRGWDEALKEYIDAKTGNKG
ncbi:MAG: dTDP-4-dehydrorhamnose reductase [Candidatus Omnitrophota bacterium]